MTIEIDGSYGEGGGQILRTSLALSAILCTPVELHHIRGGRKKPGLRPQHLVTVKAIASITEAEVKGADLGSTYLSFAPRQIRPGDYGFDIGTAGSTSLVLQCMIPTLLFAGKESRVVITGGTHVPWSPCFHYLKEVFAPALQGMGGSLDLEIERWGWYPKGGGKVVAWISPVPDIRAISRLRRGKIVNFFVLSAVSNLPINIAKRQRDQAIRRLHKYGIKVTKMETVNAPSPGTGTSVFVWALFEKGTAGFSSLGKKGKRAEKVADEACTEFFEFMASKCAIDDHLADQLVLYMALAKGRSLIGTKRVTTHLKTNVWVIEQFLPVKFEVEEQMGKISVEGIGFSA